MKTSIFDADNQHKQDMKKYLLTVVMALLSTVMVLAQGTAKITFEKTTHNFGSFPEISPKVTCTFKFTNTGNAPLIIHQAISSCGCTVPTYPKEPIKPGGSGEIKVVYDGTGKFPEHFRKTITIRTNAENEIVRLVVEGDMTPAK